jgi:predicted glycosyltransferase
MQSSRWLSGDAGLRAYPKRGKNMSQRKVMLFARDPGGANVIIPLYAPLVKKGYEVQLYGKDYALKIFENNGCQAKDIMRSVEAVAGGSILSFLKKEKPDFIITGTSADDKTEKYLWQASRELGIGSFAVLDQWINYGIRFSDYGLADIRTYDNSKSMPYLPSQIMVMDKYAKEEMIREGIPENRIVITGQPHFAELIGKIKGKNPEQIRNDKALDRDDYVILFISEPISKMYMENDDREPYLGYNEKTIIKEFLKVLSGIQPGSNKKLRVIIRPHPKEDLAIYDAYINQYQGALNIEVDQAADPLDLIIISDLICGMASMLMVEAALCGKPLISIQIGLKREDPFILSRRGLVPNVVKAEDLAGLLAKSIKEEHPSLPELDIVRGDAVSVIISNMEKMICQN